MNTKQKGKIGSNKQSTAKFYVFAKNFFLSDFIKESSPSENEHFHSRIYQNITISAMDRAGSKPAQSLLKQMVLTLCLSNKSFNNYFSYLFRERRSSIPYRI
jgi:hypothetical protein